MTTPIEHPDTSPSWHVRDVIESVERLRHFVEFDVQYVSALSLSSLAINLEKVLPLLERAVSPAQTVTVPTSADAPVSTIQAASTTSVGSPVETTMGGPVTGTPDGADDPGTATSDPATP